MRHLRPFIRAAIPTDPGGLADRENEVQEWNSPGVAGTMRHMAKPDGGMFSIKLISPVHAGEKYPYFTNDFDGTDGRCPLMNFSREGNGPSIAANVPIGCRSLVYVTHRQKFIWAIEYTGTIEAGQRAALAHGVPLTGKWSIFRPIRFLARVDLDSSPTAAEIEKLTGIRFRPNSYTLKYISAAEYQTIYGAIHWQWAETEGPKPPTSAGGLPPPPKPPEFVLPPIPNAELLLARIREVQGKPERNMEDVVKTFLILLGHPESAISFQVGRIDVRVNDEQGKSRIVMEVKRSLFIQKARRDALRKGFDYASQVGAPLVVITDADIYEVYDPHRGLDYGSKLCGRFQLTKFAAGDGVVMDLLRPANGANML
jgi:hypothetical protein